MYRQQYPDDPGMHNDYGGRHTRVTYRPNATFCERIKSSLVSFLVGVVLLAAATGLLYWNEGRAVQTSKSLNEGLSVVITLDTYDVAFQENDGHLVYVNGPLHTESPLRDDDFGVRVHAVRLKRTVEMLQWVEEKHVREFDEGSQRRIETTYSYSTEWKEELVSSSSFDSEMGHENPRIMSIESTSMVAHPVKVGNFHLSGDLTAKITSFQQLSVDFIQLPVERGKSFHMGYVFVSDNPKQPQIGDLRITWHYAGLSWKSELGDPDEVSVIAKQSGRNLMKYATEAGDELELLHVGKLSPEEMISREHAQNSMMTWAIRFGGWLLMFVGFGCLTNIVTTLVDWIPIVRDLVAMGVGAMNTALSVSLSITVIAIGWIRYRPMLGITLLVVALLPFFISRLRGRRSRPSGYHRNYDS